LLLKGGILIRSHDERGDVTVPPADLPDTQGGFQFDGHAHLAPADAAVLEVNGNFQDPEPQPLTQVRTCKPKIVRT